MATIPLHHVRENIREIFAIIKAMMMIWRKWRIMQHLYDYTLTHSNTSMFIFDDVFVPREDFEDFLYDENKIDYIEENYDSQKRKNKVFDEIRRLVRACEKEGYIKPSKGWVQDNKYYITLSESGEEFITWTGLLVEYAKLAKKLNPIIIFISGVITAISVLIFSGL
ncbi:hypothetical protein LCGC14_0540660, partial [marine sediment metagenome]